MTTRHDYHSDILPQQYFAQRGGDHNYLHLNNYDILPFSVNTFIQYIKDESIRCCFVDPLNYSQRIYLAFDKYNNTFSASVQDFNCGNILGGRDNINVYDVLNTIIKVADRDINLGILSTYFDDKRESSYLNNKIVEIFDLKVVQIEHNLPRNPPPYYEDYVLFYRITLNDPHKNMIEHAKNQQIYIDKIKSELCDPIEINHLLTIEDVTIGYSYLPHKSISNIIVNLSVNYYSIEYFYSPDGPGFNKAKTHFHKISHL